MIGQTRTSTQTPWATDENLASGFLSGINQTVKASKDALPKEVPHHRVGKGSLPKRGVWGIRHSLRGRKKAGVLAA